MSRMTTFAILSVIVLQIGFITNFKFVKIDGDSMYPTLRDKQFVVINKNINNINLNDIVVFRVQEGYAVKRVVAYENSVVKLSNGLVYLNGIVLSPYTVEEKNEKVFKLKKNEYFVIGDNHLVSYDSRDYGPISEKDIIGKVALYF